MKLSESEKYAHKTANCRRDYWYMVKAYAAKGTKQTKDSYAWDFSNLTAYEPFILRVLGTQHNKSGMHGIVRGRGGDAPSCLITGIVEQLQSLGWSRAFILLLL